jgi:DNA (cytosine-5)-methyltransferase 1
VNESGFTHVDLFAGIGGFSLAFESEGFRTVAYSEINPDKCLVYDHWFPGVQNLGDIKSINANTVGRVDVLTGGVPCQPASALGQMRGTADERWLWPETIRMVGLLRPRFAVFENPPSLIVLEGGRAWNGIVSGLVALGYDCWWDVFPAAAFGAGHLRERVLLVIADAESNFNSEQQPKDCRRQTRQSSICGRRVVENASHTNGAGLQGHAGYGADGGRWAGTRRPVATPDLRGRASKADWWHEANTGVPVLADGLPGRLVEAAARCSGDAVVPQVIQPIARAIHKILTNS